MEGGWVVLLMACEALSWPVLWTKVRGLTSKRRTHHDARVNASKVKRTAHKCLHVRTPRLQLGGQGWAGLMTACVLEGRPCKGGYKEAKEHWS